MTEEADDAPTLDEVRDWRRSRRAGGHNTDADLLALGRLVERRWAMDESSRRARGEEGNAT